VADVADVVAGAAYGVARMNESKENTKMTNETMNIETAPTLPTTGYVRQAQLLGNKGKGVPGVIPFSAATLWRKVAAKEFPAPVKLSAGITAWKVEDVREWINQH
jgi:hypothetical protein